MAAEPLKLSSCLAYVLFLNIMLGLHKIPGRLNMLLYMPPYMAAQQACQHSFRFTFLV